MRAGQRDRLQGRDGRPRCPDRVRLARHNACEKDFKEARAAGTRATSTTSTPSGTRATAGRAASPSSAASTTRRSSRATRAGATPTSSGCSSSRARSCKDTTGTHDYFGRWGPTMDGLHMLNGFHTNAYCVDGGTGGTFAEYLFPAWCPAGADRPQGVGADGDRQGAVGASSTARWARSAGLGHEHRRPLLGPGLGRAGHPDKAGRIGMWSITGTVSPSGAVRASRGTRTVRREGVRYATLLLIQGAALLTRLSGPFVSSLVANVEGRATAITVLTPVKPGGRILLRAVVFWIGRQRRPPRCASSPSSTSRAGRSSSGSRTTARRRPRTRSATATCSSRATSTAAGTRTSTPSPT